MLYCCFDDVGKDSLGGEGGGLLDRYKMGARLWSLEGGNRIRGGGVSNVVGSGVGVGCWVCVCVCAYRYGGEMPAAREVATGQL